MGMWQKILDVDGESDPVKKFTEKKLLYRTPEEVYNEM